jgi:hypothetical protein
VIAGLEGIHAWSPPGAIEPAIALGRTHDDSGDPIWPRFKLLRITGLGSKGEQEENADRPVGRPGEISRLSMRRGKSVVYEGELQARSLLALREAEEAFRAAFEDGTTLGRMDVTWHPLLTEFAAVPAKFYEARALTADIIDQQAATTWSRPYVVGLRNLDRRYFDEATEVHSVEITEPLVEVPFS